MVLNARQQAFLRNLLEGMGEQQAYEAVEGYHAQGPAAAANASRLLKNAKFRAEYEKILSRVANKAEATKERVLREDCCIAYSDIGNIFKNDRIVPPAELPESMRRAISSVKIHKRIIGNGENCVIEHTFEYRLWDKGRALERISKHLGLYEKDNRQKYDSAMLTTILSALPTEYAEKVKKALLERVGQ